MTPSDAGPSIPPPTAEELRAELLRFARRILELEAAGRLLASPADLQTVLGELRRRLFAWEIRAAEKMDVVSRRSGGVDASDVVREAREAEASLRRELEADPDDQGPEAGS